VKNIQYGIIGCGEHARRSHMLPGKEISSLQLVAVSDFSQDRMDLFEKEAGHSLAKYTSADDLLASNIDAVLIATPDDSHSDLLAKAIEAKKHVLCEKPLGVDESHLPSIGKSLMYAEDHGLIVTSCHPRRFDHCNVWLKGMLHEFTHLLGPLVSLNFTFFYQKPSREWKKGRGLLIDHLNHEIDLVHFFLGHDGFTAYKLIDEFDRYHVAGIRNDGVAFSFEGMRRLNKHAFRECLLLRFERGEIILDYGNGNLILKDLDHDRFINVFLGTSTYHKRFCAVMENFAGSIRGEEKNYLSLYDLRVNTRSGIRLTKGNTWTYIKPVFAPTRITI